MNCTECKELLVAHIEGLLDASQEKAVAEHLGDCEACRAEADTLSGLQDRLAKNGKTVAHSDLENDVMNRIVREQKARLQAAQKTADGLKMRRIIMKSRFAKIAAAAVIIIAASIALNTVDEPTSWGQVVEALNQVESVYVNVKYEDSDGEGVQQFWIRKPNCLRVESKHRIVVDNGKERLTVDKKEQMARRGQSWSSYEPVDENPAFKIVGLFRSKDMQDKMDIEAIKIAEESDKRILVYEIRYENQTGKAWVKAQTLLPQRISLSGKDESTQVVFQYEPIGNEIFSTAIPNGYSELPYLKHLKISGTVVDEQNRPVVGAVVYATRSAPLPHALPAETDESGKFSTEIIPDESGDVLFPIFLRAFRFDEPDRVAWIVLENPDERRKVGGSVADKPGQIKLVDDHGDKKFGGAERVVLQMEPAGRVTGRVTDIEGKPIPNTIVSIKPSLSGEDGMTLYPFISLGGAGLRHRHLATKTGIDGRYIFENLPRFWDKCYYRIRIIKEDYVLKDISKTKLDCPLESETFNVQMYKTGMRISGRVVNDLGKPLVSYFVAAIVDDTGRGHSAERTDENGRFELTECPIVPSYNVRVKLLGSQKDDWDYNKLTKDREFVFYPDAEVEIGYKPDKLEYDGVEIIVKKPITALEIELIDAADQPIKYFPVQVQGDSINYNWSCEKFTARTDRNGKCIIEGLPEDEQITLRLSPSNRIVGETLTEEQRKLVNENKKYRWTNLPVKLSPDKKKHAVKVTLLTTEEYIRQMQHK